MKSTSTVSKAFRWTSSLKCFKQMIIGPITLCHQTQSMFFYESESQPQKSQNKLLPESMKTNMPGRWQCPWRCTYQAYSAVSVGVSLRHWHKEVSSMTSAQMGPDGTTVINHSLSFLLITTWGLLWLIPPRPYL